MSSASTIPNPDLTLRDLKNNGWTIVAVREGKAYAITPADLDFNFVDIAQEPAEQDVVAPTHSLQPWVRRKLQEELHQPWSYYFQETGHLLVEDKKWQVYRHTCSDRDSAPENPMGRKVTNGWQLVFSLGWDANWSVFAGDRLMAGIVENFPDLVDWEGRSEEPFTG